MSADTIVAVATPPGRGAVAIVRVSGPRAHALAVALGGSAPQERRVGLRTLTDAGGGALDQALVWWAAGPDTVTGEDVAEFHVHGGPVTVEAVLGALIRLGARAAEPGEFTRRGFLNARMDLTQAEAVADLIDAETQAQARQALRQLGGDLGALYDTWRTQLIEAMAWVEADIDFPDEGDVPGAAALRAAPGLEALISAMADHLADGARGERVRDGYQIALLGAPNAGKSTLINRLAARDVAIVTEIAGTTRDVLEAPLSLAGFKVTLADTAGVRESADPIEQEGVRRALRRGEQADLRILVVDPSQPLDAVDARTAVQTLQPGDLVLINKADIAAPADLNARQVEVRALGLSHVKQVTGSAHTGDGLDALTDLMRARVLEDLGAKETPSLTRARHRQGVERAHAALVRAQARLTSAPELAGEDLRTAAHALAAVTGRVDVEDVLDRVFADFCIGK